MTGAGSTNGHNLRVVDDRFPLYQRRRAQFTGLFPAFSLAEESIRWELGRNAEQYSRPVVADVWLREIEPLLGVPRMSFFFELQGDVVVLRNIVETDTIPHHAHQSMTSRSKRAKDEAKQKTPKGLPIPSRTREEVLRDFRKIAAPRQDRAPRH